MLRKTRFILPLLGAALFSLTAQQAPLSYEEMTSHLSGEQKKQLEQSGEATLFHFDDFNLDLLPPVPQKADILDLFATQDMNMGIEGLFLNTEISPEEFAADPEGTALKLYNNLRAVKTLEGTRYYSASRGEMRDLFVESWRIPDLNSPKEQLPDVPVAAIPPQEYFFIHQKDKTFGKNESLMAFRYEAPVVSAVIINKTSMYYNGLIRVIKPNRMQIHLVIVPTDRGLLFYGVTAADALNMRVFRERANNSFYNRVKALYNWYSDALTD